jgi:hypothetical protein
MASQNLQGPEGLLLAVIKIAVDDYKRGCEDAAAYFEGPVYQWHASLLDLEPGLLPTALRRRRRRARDQLVDG